MQRIRDTVRGLEVTQDMDVVTFVPDTSGNVRVSLKGSCLGDKDDGRIFMFESRDNISDFGEWLTRLSAQGSSEPLTPSSFDTYTLDQRKWVAAVSAPPAGRGVGLGKFLSGDFDGLGTDTIEDLRAVVDSLREEIGLPSKELTRIEREAFAYPFGIPEGMTPILLATQTHDRLQLQFDELLVHSSVPLESAQQLGAWSLQGLAEIQKKSVWG